MNNNENKQLVDHRIIGQEQKLFFFEKSSPGSCFFLPRGAVIYHNLVNFLRKEYRKRGYQEVITPNIFSKELWEKSGHWQHYCQNMFHMNVDDNIYALKPMNCCSHILIFENEQRSYRDLPMRIADFGVLHRNELHGALTGLTRVRRFQQDDAHIFCTEEQIETEIANCLDFLKYVYHILGFKFSLGLSTRPEGYIGSVETWDKAEQQLTNALNNSNLEWSLHEGDGAFYGPKIDITLKDAKNRNHQCATIQLDFNLPERFNLTYQKSDGSIGQPAMIHRAIFGSVERMFAILCEEYAGRWPFWLSPYQICIIPVDPKYNNYATKVKNIYSEFQIDIDLSTDKFNKKIRNAQINYYNFIFIVGSKEELDNTVNVRTSEGNILGCYAHENVLTQLRYLRDNFVTKNIFHV